MLTRKNKKFYLDGEEFVIRSGAFHYFRALPEYWEDIMQKMKALGLNTLETYIPWNLHEPKKGQYDFTGTLDLVKFVRTAEQVGLKVLLRAGPYICAEVDNGGLPAWLLKKEYNVRLRCKTEPYLTFLKGWFDVLLPMIKPLLDTNGGPVIALAVENEYGSFGDDFEYLKEVEKVYRDAGMDCLLFNSDGATRYHIGTGRPGIHMTAAVDFGEIASYEKFRPVDEFDPDAPHFVAEYWCGNFTDWGFAENAKVAPEVTQKTFDYFASTDTSFNIYMVFGGTNFGFMNGAQDCVMGEGRYCPVVTSYDYDAAISEWTGYTEKYAIIQQALKKYYPNGMPEMPKSPKLQTVGKVAMTQSAALFDNLQIGRTQKSVVAEPMEEYDQATGYILYKKTFDYDTECNAIKLKGVRDRAYVFLNGKLIGIRMRSEDESPMKLDYHIRTGDTLEVLVENMGRLCYGEELMAGDRKGITEGIILSRHWGGDVHHPGKMLFNWDVTCLEFEDISGVQYQPHTETPCPAFFKGTFKAENRNSCFVHFENFTKGLIFVNGFHLGRYWERGPLTALYIPGKLLKEENEIVIFEAEGLKGEPSVEINAVNGIDNHQPEVIV